MQASLGGKGKVSGSVSTAGVGGRHATADPAMGANSSARAVCNRTILFWGIAMGILFLMHVGGAMEE